MIAIVTYPYYDVAAARATWYCEDGLHRLAATFVSRDIAARKPDSSDHGSIAATVAAERPVRLPAASAHPGPLESLPEYPIPASRSSCPPRGR